MGADDVTDDAGRVPPGSPDGSTAPPAGGGAGRSATPPGGHGDAGGEAGPSSSTSPTPPAPTVWAPRPTGYRMRLARRVAGALACIVGTALVAHVALSTVRGQAVDTLLMEAQMRWDGHFGLAERLVSAAVSVPAMVVVAVVVAGVAVARRRPTLAARAIAVVVGANLTTRLVKALLDRPDLDVTTALPNSLPSGHVTFAVSVALALVLVAPAGLRGPAAWAGWAWSSLAGITVMVSAWHRPSDVVTATLVAGAWALALAPVEHRQRHSTTAGRVMGVAALACLVLALAATAGGTSGVDLVSVATPHTSDYGFAAFLADQTWRARLLACAAALGVVGVVGIVMHEVDRLSWS